MLSLLSLLVSSLPLSIIIIIIIIIIISSSSSNNNDNNNNNNDIIGNSSVVPPTPFDQHPSWPRSSSRLRYLYARPVLVREESPKYERNPTVMLRLKASSVENLSVEIDRSFSSSPGSDSIVARGVGTSSEAIPRRPTIGTCVGSGFKRGSFNKRHVVASRVPLAMLFKAKPSVLKPRPMNLRKFR